MYPKLKNSALKRAEFPLLYNFVEDEIFELDEEAFELLMYFTGRNSIEDIPFKRSDVLKVFDYLRNEGCAEDLKCLDSPEKFKVEENYIPSLRYLQMHITEKCNLNCSHCYLGEKADIELPLEVAFEIIDQFARVGLKLMITGGEPLLSKDFWDIVEYASSKPIRVEVFTNGTLLNLDTVKRLSEYVHSLQISLDGLKKGHEALRGKGTFEKTLKGIKTAAKYMDVSIATMIHSRNIEEFPELSRLVETLGVKSWNLDVPARKGNLELHPDLIPDYKKAAEIYMNYGFAQEMHFGNDQFACGSHLMAVQVDGSFTKCGFFTQSVGRAGDIELLEAWKRVVEQYLPRVFELSCTCEHIDECRGGCRYRAYVEGDFYSRDRFMCMLHGVAVE